MPIMKDLLGKKPAKRKTASKKKTTGTKRKPTAKQLAALAKGRRTRAANLKKKRR